MLTTMISVFVLIVPPNIIAPYIEQYYLPIENTQYQTEYQTVYVQGPPLEINKESWLLDIQYPVDDYAKTTSGFGSRHLDNCSRCSGFHKGLDFTPGKGSPVYAVMDGVIVQVQRSGEYGVHVILEHPLQEDFVYTTVYAHLQVSDTTEMLQIGNSIKKGDILGFVGNTGLSTGPHLHFEIRLNGKHLDPVKIFSQNIIETGL